jgi:hypothetical protein
MEDCKELDEQSLKRTSTASRLIFARSLRPPPPLHHHSRPCPCPRGLQRHATTCREPLPSFEGCGLGQHRFGSSQARMQLQAPLPFPKGCGPLSFARRRIWGGRKTRGTHELGCPIGALRNTNHDKGHGSFSLCLPH